MTNSEALKMLKKLRMYHNGTYAKSIDMAIEALDKQIPMPVRVTTSTKRCSRCNRQLSAIGNIHPRRNYCTGCGQAILWEVEDD